MTQIRLLIKTKTQSYPVIIGKNLIQKLNDILKTNSIYFEKCLFVIDDKIPKKMIFQIKSSFKRQDINFIFFRASEINKNQNNVNRILNILLKKNYSRQDCLIAIGGGITGDLVGFAASLFKRGLKFINIPSTLLSQVDSSIGGKTGINTKEGKNLIGTFYQPKIVLSDINFLKTLPKREIICGYGEILKHSLISDKNFFKYLDHNITDILKLKSPFIEKTIYKSCKIKKKVVEKDEREKNIRKILNFGHTFAHAYEASLGYSKKLNHGEAVLLGIITAIKYSLKNKFLNINQYRSIIKHFEKARLPSSIKKYFSLKDLDKILSFMSKDKKNISKKINLVLLNQIGSAFYNREYGKNKIKLFLKNELSN